MSNPTALIEFQRADGHDRLARTREHRERGIAEGDPGESDAKCHQQAEGGDGRRVPEDRQAPFRALRSKGEVPQGDRQRHDDRGTESIAHVGVALDDQRQQRA